MENSATKQEVLNAMLIGFVVDNASEMKLTLQELFLSNYIADDEATAKSRDLKACHYQKLHDLLTYYESQYVKK